MGHRKEEVTLLDVQYLRDVLAEPGEELNPELPTGPSSHHSQKMARPSPGVNWLCSIGLDGASSIDVFFWLCVV